MKAALLAGVLVYAALFVFTTFVPSQQARAEAQAAGFSDEDIDRGLQYAFERNLIWWSASGAHFLLLVLLGCTSIGRRLTDHCYGWSAGVERRRDAGAEEAGNGQRSATALSPEALEASIRAGDPLAPVGLPVPPVRSATWPVEMTGHRWLLTLLAVAAIYFLVEALVSFPFGIISLEQLRAWGLTERSFGGWLRDRLIGTGIHVLLWGTLMVGLFTLIRFFPRMWWLPATAFATVLGIAYAFLLPLVILPLFNTFTPLSDTEWAKEPRVRALLEKAGVDMEKILVVDASRQGRHNNAYFTGFGPSRRIVLYDNLLEKHKPDEVESVLAHELGHWQHDHIVKGISLAVPGVLVSLLLMSRLLLAAVGRRPWKLSAPSDPAALPLVMLLITLGMWLTMPVVNGVSRVFERQADMTSLDLAGNPKAFIAAEKKLVQNNISNLASPPWSVWIFNTHPTPAEAIRMATEWAQRHEKQKREGP